ncbi:hypothetical protein evm_014155 [Chilo suppressalis]|nr:hypothetical protein evm_014155 [Chilo suppressalis]
MSMLGIVNKISKEMFRVCMELRSADCILLQKTDPERPGHLLSSAVPNYLSQPCDCISSCPMACTGQASTSRTLKEIKFKSENSDAPSTGITQFKAKENLIYTHSQLSHEESMLPVTDLAEA